MSDERPDKCPTCGSDDPGKPGNDPANRGWELKVGIVPGAGWKPCPDPFHDDARLREVERELQKCKRCDAALSELARTRRHLTTLRDAVEEVLERWDDSEVSEAPAAIYRRLRCALASLDEQEGER